ncbi:unnamed protein product [Durusdinium trenchii]|uniref:Uncharacterized protein n=1 Tax=Durusdinium trenchii TaxID=1381693 RepID=A0ABP0MA34_9DINO
MAILKLKVTPQTPKTFQMLLQTKLNTQAEFPGSKAGLQTLLGALGLTTQGDPSVSQMARVVSHALVSRCDIHVVHDWEVAADTALREARAAALPPSPRGHSGFEA